MLQHAPAIAGWVAPLLSLSLLQTADVVPPPNDAAALQKSPIVLPESASLPTSLSLQRWNGLPIIVAGINNSVLERIVIDTGLNADVVLPDAGQRLALAAATGKSRFAVMNSESSGPNASVQKLRIASLNLTEFPVALSSLPSVLSLKPHPDAPAGWLGTPFLSAFQVTFDSAAQSLYLENQKSPLRRTRDTVVVPIQLKDGRPYVMVSVPGSKPFAALIASGSPGTVLPTDVVQKLKLKPLKTDTISRQDAKPGEIATGHVALTEIPKINLGRAEWKGARILYVMPDSPKEFDRNFAVLGMDFLSQFRVTINFSRLQLAISPLTKAEPDAANGLEK